MKSRTRSITGSMILPSQLTRLGATGNLAVEEVRDGCHGIAGEGGHAVLVPDEEHQEDQRQGEAAERDDVCHREDLGRGVL